MLNNYLYNQYYFKVFMCLKITHSIKIIKIFKNTRNKTSEELLSIQAFLNLIIGHPDSGMCNSREQFN